jgi:hypothetical protein
MTTTRRPGTITTATTGTQRGHQKHNEKNRETVRTPGARRGGQEGQEHDEDKRGLETRHTDVSRDLGMFHVLFLALLTSFTVILLLRVRKTRLELETRLYDASRDLGLFYLYVLFYFS